MSSNLSQVKILVSEDHLPTHGTLIDGYGKEFEVPTYTIKDIRSAVPPECYHRSALRGFGYILRDVCLLAITFSIAQQAIPPIQYPAVRILLWSVYGLLNGLFGTGLWILAHECGHGAFSTSKTLNDVVGFILHSTLLVPYFSWKITHGKHHKSTGNMEKDMVFVPRTRQAFARRRGVPVENLFDIVEEAPIYTLAYLVARQIFGWPIHLVTNDTGHNFHELQAEGRGKGKKNGLFTGVNHFNPSSPLFEAKDEKLIVLSDVGIFVAGCVLYLIGSSFTWHNLFLWYGLPWLWVNHWLGKFTGNQMFCQ
jgi:omega-6 fatty acid desaturase / acyl-lipid omega-6 desaturase (Delta-12 desaturase)